MKKRSDEKTDEKMTGGDAASVREHVLSPEEYLSQIEFLDDDFEFQHKDGFEHVDTNFASQSYWKEAIARFKKNKGAMFSFVCILFLIVMALVGPHMNQFTYDQQIITNQNMAPRVPGLENMGILDGSETIRTSTGSKEINYYLTKQNPYGLPLDSRKEYTKSDWIIWTATMSPDQATFEKFINPLYKYINETTSRVPISDWHDTKTGKMTGFKARSVIGGYWMQVLMDKMLNNQ